MTPHPCALHCTGPSTDCRRCEQRGEPLTARITVAWCDVCGRALYADDSAVLYDGHTARRVCGACVLEGVKK